MSYQFEDGQPPRGALDGGYTFEDEPKGSSTLSVARRILADPALSLLKGAVAVPEAAVGIADLATGGRAGKMAEDYGFRPKDAKAFLDELYSPAQKAANKTVADADGFLATLEAAIHNPSTIAHAAVESVPPMLAGGVVGRAARAVPGVGPVVAGALGEGVVAAGSTAEQIRQETPGGLLIDGQAPLAAASGALTGGLGMAGGAMARKLGIADIDTMLAGGATRGAGKGMLRRGAEGALAEGVLEELPQSAQEQVAQNLALGRPWDEGVGKSAAMGMLAGGLMGGGASVLSGGGPVPSSDPMQAARDALRDAQPPAAPAAPAAPSAAPAQPQGQETAVPAPTESAPARAVDVATRTRDNIKARAAGQAVEPAVKPPAFDENLGAPNGNAKSAVPAADVQAGQEKPEAQAPAGGVSAAAPEVTEGTGTRDDPVKVKSSADIEAAVKVARDDYTPPQGEANNVQRAHVDWDGLEGTLEVAANGVRKGTNPKTGEPWETTHTNPYGYWKGTKGADGMHVDAIWGPEVERDHPVYVLDEKDENGNFRQHKTLPGFPSKDAARAAYLGISSKKPEHIMGIVELPKAEFKRWLKSGDLMRPAGEWVRDQNRADMARSVEGLKRQQAKQQARDMTDRTAKAKAAPVGSQIDARPQAGERWEKVQENAWRNVDNDERYQRTMTDEQVGRAFNVPIVEKAAASPSVPAKRQQLFVQRGRERFEVASLEEASQKWDTFRDKTGVGASEIGEGATIVDQDGKEIARISYNGKVWPPGEWKEGMKPLVGEPFKASTPEESNKLRAEAGVPPLEQAPKLLPPEKRRRAQAREAAATMAKQQADEAEIERIGERDFAAGKNSTPPRALSSKHAAAWSRGWHRANVAAPVPGVDMPGRPAAPIDTPKPAAAQFGSSNTIFTADAAEKARALLRKKLGQVSANAPLDPEIIQAGITLAGFHIEAGARTFAAYSSKMIEDLGDAVKPYLKAWYLAVRNYPGFDNAGMQSEAQLEATESTANTADRKPDEKEPVSTEKKAENAQKGPPDSAPAASTTRGDSDEPSVNADLEVGAKSQIERKKDGDGKPIFEKGERVEFFDGPNKGRHGEISEVNTWTMTTIGLTGRGVHAEGQRTERSYQVKTDNGAFVSGSPSEFRAETEKPAGVVPDIQVEGIWTQPDQVLRSIGYARSSATNARAKQARARLPKQKRQHAEEAERQDAKARQLQAAFDAWAREHPEEAKAIRGEGKPATAATPTATAVTAPPAKGMTLIPGKHTKTGAAIWTVTMAERLPADEYAKVNARAKSFGGYYSSYRGGGAVPGFIFKEEAKAKEFMGQKSEDTPIGPADTQLTYEQVEFKLRNWRAGAPSPVRASTDQAFANLQARDYEGAALIVNRVAKSYQGAWADVGKKLAGEILDLMMAGAKPQPAAPAAVLPQDNEPVYVDGPLDGFSEGDEVLLDGRAAIIESVYEKRGLNFANLADGEQGVPLWRLKHAEAAAAPQEPDSSPAPEVETPPAEADTQEDTDGQPAQTGDLPASDEGRDRDEGGARGGHREPLDAGVAAAGEGPGEGGRVPGRPDDADGDRGGRADAAWESAPRAPRDSAAGKRGPRAAGGVDHEITDADELGKGGLTKKYRDNLAAIKAIKAIEGEGRQSTAAERATIAKYVGWGGLKGVFDPDNKQWADEHKELKALLSEDEWKAARASILNAHYTSKTVVGAMYQALERIGFSGGRVLEPSVGTGNFFGLMPRPMRQASTLHGVELDVLTSKIAKHLYPSAKIAEATGFQDYRVPSGYFDVAVGNPPFGSEPIVDDDRSAYSGFSIHNYFFAKSIDKLRPGGILAMVVSHSFMDRMNPAVRNWIAQRADLVAAVRLPNTAFKENANTEVVTDVIIFQRVEERPIPKADWLETKTIEVGADGATAQAEINTYFLANPRNVLGRHSAAGSMYRANEYTVEPTGDLAEQLAGWVSELPQGLFKSLERTPEQQDSPDVSIPDGVKIGSFYVDDKGAVMQRLPDELGKQRAQAWQAPNAKAEARMRGMISLREKLRGQMRLERDPSAEERVVNGNRRALNKAYDDFVKQHGFLNNQTNRRIFLDDPEAPLLQALEVDYDQGVSKTSKAAKEHGQEPREPSAKKADILSRRVLFPPQDNLIVSTAKDAVLASLNAKGRVDLPYMASVYPKSEKAILEELGDLVFEEPETGAVVASDEYLSGDVKTKIDAAREAAKKNGKFERNVKALEKVIPQDLMPSQIYAAAGANWVPAQVYQSFLSEITGAPRPRVNYIRATGHWVINAENGDTAKLHSEFGTVKMGADDIFSALMNGRMVAIYKTIRDPNGDERRVVDEEATEAARVKYDAVKAKWESWVWSDGERANRLASIYNEKHNRTVPRKYDGAHMTFPGMSPAISLRKSQKDSVWRAVQDRVVLLDHVVGAGKTFIGAATAMEFRRLGIARKPIFAVPNHLTLAWRQEFYRLYPSANVLAATPDDFSKDNRKRLFSKITTGDWDAVIIGHSSLKKIGLPPETERAVLEEQIREISEGIETLKRERGDRNVVRDMERIKKTLEAKMKERLQNIGKRDDVVTFDEIGVDALFVDEFHEFKNLFFTTQKQRVAGLGNPTGSAKAFDMFVKDRWLVEAFGEKAPIVTMTGTPVSNSLAEMFTVQRYMQYDTLKRDGLHLFDSWAKMFGDDQGVYEVAPSGVGYRMSVRFAKFKNLPALMGYYHRFADVITLDDLKAHSEAEGKRFPVPKVRGGRPQIVVAKKSARQNEYIGEPMVQTDEKGAPQFKADPDKPVTIEKAKDADKWVLATGNSSQHFETEEEARLAYVASVLSPVVGFNKDSLLDRFANLRDLMRQSKGRVNALSLTGLANKVALDYRLIDPRAPDFAGSKINEAVGRMMATYEKWSADRGAQLVFCDLSVPLSARKSMSEKESRVYVRDPQSKALVHKRGTVHTVAGYEGFPYYLVGEGKGAGRLFSIFDPVTGALLRSGIQGKAEAHQFVADFLKKDGSSDKWLDFRDRTPEITDEEIEDYKNEHELSDGEEVLEITRQDLEGVAGPTQFSVYDDMKAKLLQRGVPEREIAFIHDYDTPKAKLELYKRVNRGDVRFLFGSTPKLGAGTNVQQRLVALHHIDAPWRPSDLEQREGRIIRQGNALYERDPDGFEVEILRYATEQTYDTRRWQIIEHKAAGVEQLRKYGGELEIEDIAGEASNAAEMKAAASGSPLILKETELRNEVKRLENLRRAHADELFAFQRAYRSNRQAAEESLPRKLAELEERAATLAQNPVPEEGLPAMTVDGKLAGDKDAAIGMLEDAWKRVATAEPEDARVTKIDYRGLRFYMTRPSATMVGVGTTRDAWPDIAFYEVDGKGKFSPSGLLTRLANFAERTDAAVADVKADIERLKAENVRIKPLLNRPFGEEGALQQAKQDHTRVQRQLMKEDIATAIKPQERAKVEEEIKRRREMLKGRGFAEALRELDAEDEGRFSRTTGTGKGLGVAKVKKILEPLVKEWADTPDIVILPSIAEAPEKVRKLDAGMKQKGGKDTPQAVFYQGKVYVLADAIDSPWAAYRAVFHEVLGHYGIRKHLGKDLVTVLHDVVDSMPDRVKVKALEYGLDWKNEDHKLEAAEEVLAEIAQRRPQAGLVKRAIAAIRRFLRKLGLELDLSESDIIVNFIIPAREIVERGGKDVSVTPKDDTRFSRGKEVKGFDFRMSPDKYRDNLRGMAEDAEEIAAAAEAKGDTKRAEMWRKKAAEHRAELNDDRDASTFGGPRFSRVDAMQAAVTDELGNLLTSQRTFNRFWHRTVGTQFHKAKQDRHFKRVFDLGQDYLTDTSRYAMKAEAEAPNLLLRLEGAGDILKRGISKADKKAISAPIFEGTLEEKTWSDADLRERFHLNDRQIGQYREFRAAVDLSLDELAKSTIAKMAKAIGVRMDGLMDLRELPLAGFHEEVRGLMKQRADLLKQLADDAADPGAKALAEARAAEAKKQVTATAKLFNRIQKLKTEGYAPLMRFGEYTVYVTEQGENGETEQVFFGMYETQREANAAAKALAEEHPDAEIRQGILSAESWKVFQGVSPDTLEIFGKAAGLDENPLFQEYLRLAVNNRSAMKRLIHRKGTPGFSDDVTRVLASFVTSNARLTSSNYHLGEMQAAVEAIPKEKGDVRDEATNLWKYLVDPVEEAGALRGFLFAQFLGGSIASALVNATQPVTMTAPYLVQYADAGTVAKELGKATMEAAKNQPGADVRQAYQRAVEEGLVAPHEIYQLMAQARGNAMGATGIGRAMKVWGAFFSLAEAFNRRSTFIAAYRIAVAKDMANPYDFAKRAVHETQGLYNKGNRPNWARGSFGATIFTFRQFSIAYVEFLKRLHDSNPKAFWLTLAILMLAAGAEGLPFAEDLEDVIDTIGQWLGYATNSKRWLRDRATEALGEGGAAFVLHGFSAIPGVPLDVSLRMGLANLIPGTALFKRSTTGDEKAREALEVVGPIGGVVQNVGRGLEAAGKGEFGAAARAVLPTALANLFKGAEMWEKGYYTDSRGNRVMDVTKGESILKAAGFQPASVAQESRAIGIVKESADLHRITEDGIADKWARGIVDDKPEIAAEAQRELETWNERNPERPISITRQQIRQRVLTLRRTRAERFTRSAPKEMRGEVARELGPR